MAEETKLQGWKTKYGAIGMAVGTGLMGAAEVAPSETWKTWMFFVGTLLTGGGGALAGVGIGHKLDKAKEASIKAQP